MNISFQTTVAKASGFGMVFVNVGDALILCSKTPAFAFMLRKHEGRGCGDCKDRLPRHLHSLSKDATRNSAKFPSRDRTFAASIGTLPAVWTWNLGPKMRRCSPILTDGKVTCCPSALWKLILKDKRSFLVMAQRMACRGDRPGSQPQLVLPEARTCNGHKDRMH